MANVYQVGDLVRVTGTFTDGDGNAQDPDAVLCQVRDPSKTTVEYEYGADAEVVKDSTGVYHVDVDVDEAGWWAYRWYATGTGQAADEGRFRAEDSEFD